jgi:hypothetical protein
MMPALFIVAIARAIDKCCHRNASGFLIGNFLRGSRNVESL